MKDIPVSTLHHISQTNNSIKVRMVYIRMFYLLQTVITHKYISSYQYRRLGWRERKQTLLLNRNTDLNKKEKKGWREGGSEGWSEGRMKGEWERRGT